MRLSGQTSGRPRSMSATQSLALCLAWFRTRGSTFTLCMLFGITSSVCSLFLRFSRRVLLRTLQRDRRSVVKLPSQAELRTYQNLISERHSALGDVFAVADGLKLYLEQAGDTVIQEMFYNGWTHDHYVGNVFAFAPSGLIIACTVNCPGTMHDSQICDFGGLYDRLGEYFERYGGRIVVDSAFCRGDFPYLIKSAQDESAANGLEEVVTLRQATALRQAAEWGMRAFQGSFPRMKDRFIYEENGERKVVLWATVLLFNIRSRLVGLNQIQSTYMPHLSVEANFFLRDTFGF